MTSIGKLVECIEDLEIIQQQKDESIREFIFYEGVYYTALIEDRIVIIDREHKNIEIEQDFFNRFFKLK